METKLNKYAALLVKESELLFSDINLYKFYKPYIDIELFNIKYDCSKSEILLEVEEKENDNGTYSLLLNNDPLINFEITDEKTASGYKINYEIIKKVEIDNLFPNSSNAWSPEKLCELVKIVKEIVSAGLSIRSSQKIKTRQPLNKVTVICQEQDKFELELFSNDICSELNVEAVEFVLPDKAENYVNFLIKPNFKNIGSKFRSLVPSIKKALASANGESILSDFKKFGYSDLMLENESVRLTAEDVEVQLLAKEGYSSLSFDRFVVSLDTTITEDLYNKGIIREIKTAIQSMRKDQNLELQTRINLDIFCSEKMKSILENNFDYIKKQTLSNCINFVNKNDSFKILNLDNEHIYLKIPPLY